MKGGASKKRQAYTIKEKREIAVISKSPSEG